MNHMKKLVNDTLERIAKPNKEGSNKQEFSGGLNPDTSCLVGADPVSYRSAENIVPDAKFLITTTYPDNDRQVILDIKTGEPLKEAFFTELMELLTKHTK